MGKTYNSRSKARPERRKWCPEEDQLLQKAIEKHGTKNWGVVAAAIRGRHPKQCRERWINHLDPQIVKGKMTDEEWDIVVKTHQQQGNRWSEIAKLLPGRTPNQIKNYWHTMARRSDKQNREDDDEDSYGPYNAYENPQDKEEQHNYQMSLLRPQFATTHQQFPPVQVIQRAADGTPLLPFQALIACAEEMNYMEKSRLPYARRNSGSNDHSEQVPIHPSGGVFRRHPTSRGQTPGSSHTSSPVISRSATPVGSRPPSRSSSPSPLPTSSPFSPLSSLPQTPRNQSQPNSPRLTHHQPPPSSFQSYTRHHPTYRQPDASLRRGTRSLPAPLQPGFVIPQQFQQIQIPQTRFRPTLESLASSGHIPSGGPPPIIPPGQVQQQAIITPVVAAPVTTNLDALSMSDLEVHIQTIEKSLFQKYSL